MGAWSKARVDVFALEPNPKIVLVTGQLSTGGWREQVLPQGEDPGGFSAAKRLHRTESSN